MVEIPELDRNLLEMGLASHPPLFGCKSQGKEHSQDSEKEPGFGVQGSSTVSPWASSGAPGQSWADLQSKEGQEGFGDTGLSRLWEGLPSW